MNLSFAHRCFHLRMTRTVLEGVLRKLPELLAYADQLRHVIKENYPPESVKCADLVLTEDDEECFAKRVFFTDDTFLLHTNGHVNRHEYRACRT